MIGFSQANFNAEPYRQHVNDRSDRPAKNYPQFKLQIADGAGNVNTQVSQVENFLTQQVDLMLISPFEAAPLTPVVSRAYVQGRHSGDRARPQDGRRARQGLHGLRRRRQHGKIAFRGRPYTRPRHLLPERRRGGGPGRAAEFDAGDRAARTASRTASRRTRRSRWWPTQAADWLPDKAQVTAFAAMLQAHPDIKMVYASNDMMAASARGYIAAKQAPASKDQVKIIGTDGLPGPAGGIRAVAEGEWAATFTYPTGAPEAIAMAKSILLDCAASVPTTVTVPTLAITDKNAKSLMGK